VTAAPERILSVRRVSVSVLAGVVCGGVVAAFGAAAPAILTGWVVSAGTALAWVWRVSWPLGAAGTKRLAEAESRSTSTDAAVLIAAVVSLAAVIAGFLWSSAARTPGTVAVVMLGLASVVLAWALVNTVFALKYARLYYFDEDGGIDFKQADPPSYSDFAYLAFTVGMSYAVSETEPTDPRIRRVVLGHALLSYAFGTGVLAVALNLVTGLGQS
jgi:uncharacterized membrane protein